MASINGIFSPRRLAASAPSMAAIGIRHLHQANNPGNLTVVRRLHPVGYGMLSHNISPAGKFLRLVTKCSQDKELAKKKCVPCESKNLKPMSLEAAEELLQQIPGWNILNEDGKLRLHRDWKVKTFLKGLEFFKHVADVAEAEGHHPDLHLVSWNNASIDIWTHSIGGLTENDFILAAKISSLDVGSLLRIKPHAKESFTPS
uniref:4a-hydroxytetrahydrobiopterin dehydratase n=1 Tax=Araucaria cunninghamii TaxID=56994 RepID=A0A0D6R992_ARACU